ncbi:ABC transporter permease [Mesobacillus foraminis]|uniref:ABC transporter permease n=1 Tax=Mesobacillus foraminis TaxID=279826 RepID=UPI0039A34806
MNFLNIAKKDIKLMLKDPGALVVLFLLPMMLITIMSFALKPVYGDQSDAVKILVADLDKSEDSKRYIEGIDEVEGMDVDELDKESEIEKSVQDGENPMGIIIPKGFQDSLEKGEKIDVKVISDMAQLETVSVLQKAIEGVAQSLSVNYEISSMVDEQVASINQTMETQVNDITKAYEERIASLTAQLPQGAGQPANQEAVPANGDAVNTDELKSSLTSQAQSSMKEPMIGFVTASAKGEKEPPTPDAFQQNVPGFTVMYAFFIVMYAGRSFLNEKSSGTFTRILNAPVNRWTLFFGKMLPNFIVGIAQVAVLFAFGYFVFDMSLGSSPLGLAAISIALVWASSCLGMLIAALFKTEAQVNGWSVLIVLTLAALGGTMVPLFIMPDFMKQLALITPHAWALNGFQDILVRGGGLEDVISNIGVLFAFGLAFLLVSVWKLKFD